MYYSANQYGFAPHFAVSQDRQYGDITIRVGRAADRNTVVFMMSPAECGGIIATLLRDLLSTTVDLERTIFDAHDGRYLICQHCAHVLDADRTEHGLCLQCENYCNDQDRVVEPPEDTTWHNDSWDPYESLQDPRGE